jgi:hypothetical protein
MKGNVNCPECGRPLAEGIFTKDGKTFTEHYCQEESCKLRFETLAVLPLMPLTEEQKQAIRG